MKFAYELFLKGKNLNISPVNIKNKLCAFKNELKEYYSPDNVMPDEKTKTKVRILQGSLLCLAALAVGAVALKKSGKFDLDVLTFKQFKKDGFTRGGITYYENKPFNGKIRKYMDDKTLSVISYYNGKLESVCHYDPSTAKVLKRKKYIYDKEYNLRRVCTNGPKFSSVLSIEESGRIVNERNGKITRVIQPLSGSRLRITDYSNCSTGKETIVNI